MSDSLLKIIIILVVAFSDLYIDNFDDILYYFRDKGLLLLTFCMKKIVWNK